LTSVHDLDLFLILLSITFQAQSYEIFLKKILKGKNFMYLCPQIQTLQNGEDNHFQSKKQADNPSLHDGDIGLWHLFRFQGFHRCGA
jgi:hypothetical protein